MAHDPRKVETPEMQAAIAAMVEQCIVGNQQIAEGNNSTASHIAIAEGSLGLKDLIAAGKSTCEALRTTAAEWDGTRKEFIAAAEAAGVNKATAATQWQKGRKA